MFPKNSWAFSFIENFSKIHEIFFWKMFIKSVVFSLNFFPKKIMAYLFFETKLLCSVYGCAFGWEWKKWRNEKKKWIYINLLIHLVKKWCLIKTKKWQATKKEEAIIHFIKKLKSCPKKLKSCLVKQTKTKTKPLSYPQPKKIKNKKEATCPAQKTNKEKKKKDRNWAWAFLSIKHLYFFSFNFLFILNRKFFGESEDKISGLHYLFFFLYLTKHTLKSFTFHFFSKIFQSPFFTSKQTNS